LSCRGCPNRKCWDCPTVRFWVKAWRLLKKLLALLFVLAGAAWAESVEVALPAEPEKSWVEEAEDVAEHMNDLEMCLREDRTDQTVQVKGKEIEEELEKLIKVREAQEKKDAKGPKDAKKPDKDSTLTAAERFEAKFARMGEIERARWISMPSVYRGEIVQVYAAEVPATWKRRIEAYFVSICAEETAALTKAQGCKEEKKEKKP